MKILYLSNHLNIGGITSYLLTLARGLKSRGHEVYIASSSQGLTAGYSKEGFTFFPIPIRTKKDLSPKIIFSRIKLSGLIREYNIGLVHSNTRTTQILGCLLSKSTGCVHITTCHGYFKRRLLRRIFPCWGDKIIAVSEQVKEHLLDDFKVEADKVKVIHNGIDLEKFKITDQKSKSEAKRVLGFEDSPVLGIIARLSDVKGHTYLIRAFPEVLDSFPEAKLLLVGRGKMQAELLKLVKGLNIQNSVFFMPEVCDTMEMLAAMDIFVMPSLKEGLGLALMEAMASAIPVIGSNIGGIKSLIKDGTTGLLVEPSDIKGLTVAMLDLLENKDKAAALGKNARKFIRENFSQELMVEQTEALYLECLKNRG
ncbi:MAG TPA: glycosyltransferase family 4 protein [Candidatus Margulisiibacteriota bacterium]|nr:glycosyltransferase family 4 protein [Candidatus Margulisiibacteriota bacterium]